MNALLLVCATIVATMNCQIGSASLQRTYELESAHGLFMCQLETQQKAAGDPEVVALLDGGGFYPKVFCTMGRVQEPNEDKRG